MGLTPTAPGTTTIMLPSGEAVSLQDWLDFWYYGTLQLTNGVSTPISVYSNSLSQPIPGGTRILTRVDTNIPRSGDNGFPKGYSMLVFSIAMKLSRATRPNANQAQPSLDSFSDPVNQRTFFNLDRVIAFQYKYNNKLKSEGVIQDYPTGHGMVLFTTNAAREQVNNGVASPRDRVAWVLPIYEREQIPYNGTFQPEAPLAIAQAASDGGADLDFADLKVYKVGFAKFPVV